MEKYEYLTGEDLGHRPGVLEKLSLSILHWACHLVNHLKKIMLKILQIVRVVLIMPVGFNYASNYKFYKFCNRHDQFEDMSLDSKYNWIKEFNNLRIKLKLSNQKKTETQLKKERIMKSFDEPYEKYYNYIICHKLTSLVSLLQGDVKKFKKSMKIDENS